MKTGKIIAYNPCEGRGILESRLTGLTYRFVAAAVTFKEANLIKPGVQVFWKAHNDTRMAHYVEIMSTELTRFKTGLQLEGSIALD